MAHSLHFNLLLPFWYQDYQASRQCGFALTTGIAAPAREQSSVGLGIWLEIALGDTAPIRRRFRAQHGIRIPRKEALPPLFAS